MSSGLTLTVLLLSLASCSLGSDAHRRFSAHRDASTGGWQVSELGTEHSRASSPCASGDFQDKLNTTGWSFLTLKGNADCSISDMGYALGLIEGAATAYLIDDAFVNYNASNQDFLVGGHLPAVVQDYLYVQMQWMQDQIATNVQSDNATLRSYWQQVESLLSHLQGVCDGYLNHTLNPQPLTCDQVQMLAYMGDLEDLERAVPYINVSQPPLEFSSSRRPPPKEDMMDCSGLIKLDPEFKDLWTGHTTFNAYWCMLRVFKHYEVPGPDVVSPVISFSSRPGDLHSKDDFFLLSGGKTVIETSLTVFNESLYSALRPQTVPCWIRSQVANRLASSAPHWAQLFSAYNSGTHNNEWIVADYSVFRPNQRPPPNTVWMLEQMVDVIEAADVTDLLLKQLYIPSYNIPYFKKIFNISGYGAQNFSYDHDPRANIFRRDHHKVSDVVSLGALMNMNDWQNDPLALGSPCNQISARCDIGPNGYAFGGIDAKAVNSTYVQTQHIRVIGGPSHTYEKVFTFLPQYVNVSHQGMPISWNFDWLITTPADL